MPKPQNPKATRKVSREASIQSSDGHSTIYPYSNSKDEDENVIIGNFCNAFTKYHSIESYCQVTKLEFSFLNSLVLKLSKASGDPLCNESLQALRKIWHICQVLSIVRAH